MFFVVETIALGMVMQLWNLHWLPLAAVFIDWELLLSRIGISVAAPDRGSDRKPPRASRWYIVAFVVYDVITAFVPRIDQRLNTYPFSGFPMFAIIRARQPYDEHLPYSVAAVRFQVIADQPMPEAESWLDDRYRTSLRIHTHAELHQRLAHMLLDVRARFPGGGVHGVRAVLTIFEAPAYPAPARLEPHPIALLGEYDGAFHSMLGTSHADHGYVVVSPGIEGVDAANAHLVAYRDEIPVPQELAVGPGPWTVERIPGDPVYYVAIAGGRPWLVAATRTGRRR